MTVFLGVTFAVSWSAWGLLLARGNAPTAGGPAVALWMLGGFGPTVAALVAAGLDGRDELRQLLRGLLRWQVGLRWYALILPLAVAVAALLILGARSPVDVSLAAAAAAAAPSFVFNAIAGGGNEELGWRGYALPRLERRVGPLAASVLLGVVWATCTCRCSRTT